MKANEILVSANQSEDENLQTTTGAEKKSNRPTTPDEPAVPFKTCEEYRKYMAGTPDDNPRPKHNPAPTDGLTLSQLGQKTDGEILGIINQASCIPKKSDIRNMYANGYAFTWGELTIVARFLGFKISNPGDQNPHYYKDDVVEISVRNEQEGIIYIDHGKRDTIVRKYSLSESTVEKEKRLLGNKLSNSEKSKVIDVIYSTALDQRLEDQKAGRFGVCYRPQEEERLI